MGRGSEIAAAAENVSTSVKALMLVAKFFRAIGLEKFPRLARQHISRRSITNIHLSAMHPIREYFVDSISTGDVYSIATAGRVLTDSLLDPFADILEVKNRSDLHCTIKIFKPAGTAEVSDDMIYTLARSGGNSRPSEMGMDNARPVKENSCFASCLGVADSITNWPIPVTAFSCPDLKAHAEKFVCGRTNHLNFYGATLVFPLRVKRAVDENYQFLGFFTIDTLAGLKYFKHLPDIFSVQPTAKELQSYMNLLNGSPVYHLGGVVADALALAFYQHNLLTDATS